jgi:hypothetical protein
MDALSNVYINSVEDMIDKLKTLNSIEVVLDMKVPVAGEQVPQVQIKSGNEALFKISGEFIENEMPQIPEEFVIIIKIDKFNPPPVGTSKREDFDPVVHMEIEPEGADEEEVKDAGEEEPEPEEVDEESKLLLKPTVPNIHKLWLRLTPTRNEFINLIAECFSEGMESLRTFERWSRHEDLVPYVQVLESWDDKVCDEWEPPDDNYLNCDEWLEDHPLFVNQRSIVSEQINEAFDKSEIYLEFLNPLVHQYWENQQIDYEMIKHERLKSAVDTIDMLLDRFLSQK